MPLKRRAPIRRWTRLKRGRPPGRQPKSEWQKQRNEADDLWKAIVHLWGDVCAARAYPGCLGTRILQAHHMVKRGFYGTRWELSNGVLVCRNCHNWLHKKCLDEPQWYRDHGVDYDALKLRAETVRRKDIDVKLVILDLKARKV